MRLLIFGIKDAKSMSPPSSNSRRSVMVSGLKTLFPAPLSLTSSTGAFGVVSLVREKSSGALFAMKEVLFPVSP